MKRNQTQCYDTEFLPITAARRSVPPMTPTMMPISFGVRPPDWTGDLPWWQFQTTHAI